MNIQHLYFAGGATSDTAPDGSVQAEDEPKLVWKVLLRTGTWKLRPGPGGVKVNKPLSVYRDKAPAGHISLAEIKKSFDATAIEYVTAPILHADGTMDNKGFIKKLAIQDVAGEDGSGETVSLLWAGFEITEPDVAGMIKRKTIPSVSAGVVFDYERPEDGKKFGQVLVHAMLTHKPWINKTGPFVDDLPEGVMATDVLSEGEKVSFFGFSIDLESGVKPDEPPDPGGDSKTKPGTVVWSPDQGYQFTRGRVQKALDNWRRTVLRQKFPDDKYDIPYYNVDDVSRNSDKTGAALICSGYGSEREAWVANFKDTDDGVEIDAYQNWVPAKQEWVAASQQQEPGTAPVATGPKVIPSPPEDTDPLRAAQRRRAEVTGLGIKTTTNRGAMSGINLANLLSGVELSDEQRAGIQEAQTELSETTADREKRDREARQIIVDQYVGTADKKGKLDELGFGDPGIKAYVRSVLLSDDGQPALAFSEFAPNGAKTEPVAKTASDVLKGFIDTLPKATDGRVSLSAQAKRLPDDPPPKPDDENEAETPAEGADALIAELAEQGFDIGLQPAPTTTTAQGA